MKCPLPKTVVSFLAGAMLLLVTSSISMAQPLEIFVSVPPLAHIVERMGGDLVSVHVLVPDGQDPHTFEPLPKQILALSRADLYLTVDMPFEKQIIAKVRNNEGLSIIDISKGITKRVMAAHHHNDHEVRGEQEPGHEEEAHHEEHAGESDPHVWLAPPLIKVLAGNILHALTGADQAHSQNHQRNYALLSNEIDSVHRRIANLLKPYKGQSFYVFHPAFGYLGETYGLHQKAVELEGKSPTPKQLAELIKDAQADNVRIIFVQPQFDPKSAASVATSIGGSVVPIDPLAKDLLNNLEMIARKLGESLLPDTRNTPPVPIVPEKSN